MALRSFVTEGDGCTVTERPGAQNALSSLANNIFGQSSKYFQQYQELPGTSKTQQNEYNQSTYIDAQKQQTPLFNKFSLNQLFQKPEQQIGQVISDREFQNNQTLQINSEQHYLQVFQQANLFYNQVKTEQQAPYRQQNLSNFSTQDKIKIYQRSQVLARQTQQDRIIQKADQKVFNFLESLNIDPKSLPQLSQFQHQQVDPLQKVWQQQQQKQQASGWVNDFGNQQQIQQKGQGWVQDFQIDSQIHNPNLSNSFLAQAPQNWVQQYSQNKMNAQNTQMFHNQQHKVLNNQNQSWVQQYNNEQSNDFVSQFQSEQDQQQNSNQNVWANEFSEQQQEQGSQLNETQKQNVKDQSKSLAAALQQSTDPKIRNSKFLSFLNQVGTGQIDISDKEQLNKLQNLDIQDNQWASEFGTQQANMPSSKWTQEFSQQNQFQNMEAAYQIVKQQNGIQVGQNEAQVKDWVQDFDNEQDILNQAYGYQDNITQPQQSYYPMSQNFQQMGQTPMQYGSMNNQFKQDDKNQNVMYDDIVKEILKWSGQYTFEQNNPFKQNLSLDQAKKFYEEGILSEALLVLEGIVQQNPQNKQAWKLLGSIQGENENDVQAVAAHSEALKIDPTDLDVLQMLGVNHANELQITPTSLCLLAWIKQHPQLSKIYQQVGQPQDKTQIPEYVSKLLTQAKELNPQDLNINVALGTQQHMLKKFTEASQTFKGCTEIQSNSFNLWNKLGASLANGRDYSNAIGAYQKALELKPNYVRAWANLGISLASLGQYREACKVYTRAIIQNPNQSQLWTYLQSCTQSTGDFNMLPHIESRNIQALRQQYQLVFWCFALLFFGGILPTNFPILNKLYLIYYPTMAYVLFPQVRQFIAEAKELFQQINLEQDDYFQFQQQNQQQQQQGPPNPYYQEQNNQDFDMNQQFDFGQYNQNVQDNTQQFQNDRERFQNEVQNEEYDGGLRSGFNQDQQYYQSEGYNPDMDYNPEQQQDVEDQQYNQQQENDVQQIYYGDVQTAEIRDRQNQQSQN